MAVSKHLKVLDEAGLVRREKEGRVRRCSYDPASPDGAREWIEKHERFWTQQLDSLATYLEAPDRDCRPAGGGGEDEELHSEEGEGG